VNRVRPAARFICRTVSRSPRGRRRRWANVSGVRLAYVRQACRTVLRSVTSTISACAGQKKRWALSYSRHPEHLARVALRKFPRLHRSVRRSRVFPTFGQSIRFREGLRRHHFLSAKNDSVSPITPHESNLTLFATDNVAYQRIATSGHRSDRKINLSSASHLLFPLHSSAVRKHMPNRSFVRRGVSWNLSRQFAVERGDIADWFSAQS